MRVPTLTNAPNLTVPEEVLREVIEACTRPPEPRWPAMLALLAVAGLYTALPSSLTIHHPHWGPRWLLFAVVSVLLIPTVITFKTGRDDLNHIFGFAVLAVVTAAEGWSMFALIRALTQKNIDPPILLRSALALWIVNILVFALWYWRLDAGGPNARDDRHVHERGAFLFPPMTLDDERRADLGLTHWRPQFIDYLFLAFNHSTAFSPTDTAILSRWAKALVMIQAGVSLMAVTLLAARAVNIL